MNKFLSLNYWFFRVIIPGGWAVGLVLAVLWIFQIDVVIKHVPAATSTYLAATGVGLGFFLHYVVGYPRKKRRFSIIEEASGPIQYILAMCRQCGDLCRIEKTYKAIAYCYFSVLNDVVPSGTRHSVYYFSSLYYCLVHMAFVSSLVAAAVALCGVWGSYSRGVAPNWFVVSFVALLAVKSWYLGKENSPAERYLVQMFEIQREWVKRNEALIREHLCSPFRFSL